MRAPSKSALVRKLRKILADDDADSLSTLMRTCDVNAALYAALGKVRAGRKVFEALLEREDLELKKSMLLREIEKNDPERAARVLRQLPPGTKILCSKSVFYESASVEMDNVLIRGGYAMDYAAMEAVLIHHGSVERARNFVAKGFNVHTLDEFGRSLYDAVYQWAKEDDHVTDETVTAIRFLVENGLPLVKEEVADFDYMTRVLDQCVVH